MEPVVIVTIVLSIIFVVIVVPLAIIAKKTTQNKLRIDQEDQTTQCERDISDLKKTIEKRSMQNDDFFKLFDTFEEQNSKNQAILQKHVDEFETLLQQWFEKHDRILDYEYGLKTLDSNIKRYKLFQTINTQNIDEENAKLEEKIGQEKVKMEKMQEEIKKVENKEEVARLQNDLKMLKTQLISKAKEAIELQENDNPIVLFRENVEQLIYSSENLITSSIRSQWTTEIYKSKIHELQRKLQNNINALCEFKSSLNTTKFPQQNFESILPSEITTEIIANIINELKTSIQLSTTKITEIEKVFDEKYDIYKKLKNENEDYIRNSVTSTQEKWEFSMTQERLHGYMTTIYEIEKKKKTVEIMEIKNNYEIEILKEQIKFFTNLYKYYEKKVNIIKKTVPKQMQDWNRQLYNIAAERRDIMEQWQTIT